jgi:hypothetical protein
VSKLLFLDVSCELLVIESITGVGLFADMNHVLAMMAKFGNEYTSIDLRENMKRGIVLSIGVYSIPTLNSCSG